MINKEDNWAGVRCGSLCYRRATQGRRSTCLLPSCRSSTGTVNLPVSINAYKDFLLLFGTCWTFPPNFDSSIEDAAWLFLNLAPSAAWDLTSEIFDNYSPSIAARDLQPFLPPTSNHPQPLPDSGRDGEWPNIVSRIYNSVTNGMDEFVGNRPVPWPGSPSRAKKPHLMPPRANSTSWSLASASKTFSTCGRRIYRSSRPFQKEYAMYKMAI